MTLFFWMIETTIRFDQPKRWPNWIIFYCTFLATQTWPPNSEATGISRASHRCIFLHSWNKLLNACNSVTLRNKDRFDVCDPQTSICVQLCQDQICQNQICQDQIEINTLKISENFIGWNWKLTEISTKIILNSCNFYWAFYYFLWMSWIFTYFFRKKILQILNLFWNFIEYIYIYIYFFQFGFSS